MQGFSGEGASNDSGVIENVNFRAFRCYAFGTLGNEANVIIYVVLFSPLFPFQWPQYIWPWMTLTGYIALNSVFAPVYLADTVRLRKIIAWKQMKID